MSIRAITIDSSMPEVRPAIVAWSTAVGLGSVLVGAGLMSSTPLPVFGWAAAFLFFAVASDVRFHRIPNWLTLPAFLVALIVSPWAGAAGGFPQSLAGAALGFALLIGPYALGGMGAGDVKALMVLGAWLGAEVIFGAAVWAVIAGGAFGFILLALRGELFSYAQRWSRTFFKTLSLRRFAYERPSVESIASGGIPFAAAIAVGLAMQWYGGPPW